MKYSDIAWLPLTGGLALLGLIASWFAWRRRGVAAGLRGVAWSLLPIAAYLIGVIALLWKFGTAIGSFATSFVFSPKVWAGLIVVVVAFVLFVVSGRLRSARPRKQPAGNGQASVTRPASPPPGITAGKGKGKAAAPMDDEFAEIEQILRRRNIR
jgi:hypothetical protein